MHRSDSGNKMLLILLVDRTDKHTKLEIDLIEITKYIYLTLTLYFNSHTLLHSSHASSIQLSTGHLPDHICFFVTMLALNCSRIHLSDSFFLLPWNISNTQITPHHSYTLTLATLILPYKRHVFSLIYGNHYHNYDRH